MRPLATHPCIRDRKRVTRVKRPTVHPGDFTRTCDRTGFRVLASDTRKEWDGSMVWNQVYEPRQPQDFLRGIPDNQTVPDARPKAEPVFLATNAVSRNDL